ncbi:uncharacterized protein LOC120269114 [Dioscorea cayenensis subsp. rotundata]|uniref:Uncharacterized protein LOC120269114 n=1 Tax=Dioscorea cayennensis subsp. rotundata TaxID=55577 RepID=A0AB40C1J7_DIOCR|nr:uncharacterized protein LOC120269114 [Dioscorea cayenensis subsp. rotundata]
MHNNLLANAVKTTSLACEMCNGPHQSFECPTGNSFSQMMTVEQAQYVGNFNRQQDNPYSNRYNPGWRNHPNLSWKNNSTMQEQSNPPQEKKINLEEAMTQLATTQTQFMNETRTSLQNQSAQIRNLEVQLSQMASMLTERQQGNLPSTSEANPRKSGNEQCSAIILRSGKELKMPEKKSESVDQKHDQDNLEHNKYEAQIEAPLPQDRFTRIPFPQRLKKNKLDQQFAKFLDIFKKLHINIPFAEALEQMPSYVKFMKEILSNKRKLKDYETVALTEECSAILQKKLPPKLKDPGSFTIPCSIGNVVFERALCDLGSKYQFNAIINLQEA